MLGTFQDVTAGDQALNVSRTLNIGRNDGVAQKALHLILCRDTVGGVHVEGHRTGLHRQIGNVALDQRGAGLHPADIVGDGVGILRLELRVLAATRAALSCMEGNLEMGEPRWSFSLAYFTARS